jgi:hypothetical protein
MCYGAHLLIHPADSSLLLFNTRMDVIPILKKPFYYLLVKNYRKTQLRVERFDKSKKPARKNICGWEQFQCIKAQRKKLTQCCCYVILSTGFGNQ